MSPASGTHRCRSPSASNHRNFATHDVAVLTRPPLHTPVKPFIPLVITVAATLWTLAPGRATEPDPLLVSVTVEGGDTLAIRLPPGWKPGDNKSERTSPVLLDLSSPGGLQVKLAIVADPDGRFSTREALDE